MRKIIFCLLTFLFVLSISAGGKAATGVSWTTYDPATGGSSNTGTAAPSETSGTHTLTTAEGTYTVTDAELANFYTVMTTDPEKLTQQQIADYQKVIKPLTATRETYDEVTGVTQLSIADTQYLGALKGAIAESSLSDEQKNILNASSNALSKTAANRTVTDLQTYLADMQGQADMVDVWSDELVRFGIGAATSAVTGGIVGKVLGKVGGTVIGRVAPKTVGFLSKNAVALGRLAALGTAAGIAGTTLFSRALANYLNFGGSGCWFCPIFKACFQVINTIATNVYNALAATFVGFIAIIGALWILILAIQYVTTLNVPNTGEFFTKLFKGLLKMIVGAAILSCPISVLFNYTVNPIATFSAGVSTTILETMEMVSGTVTTVSFEEGASGGRMVTKQENLCKPSDSSTFSDISEMALDVGVYDAMSCMLKTMSAELITGIAVGINLVAHSIHAGHWGFPSFNVLLIGGLLSLGFFMIFFIFPWKLIDILIRLGFTIALTPLYVLFWVFPITAGYTKKGWSIFVTAMFTLLSLSVLMVVAMQLLGAGLNESGANMGDLIEAMYQDKIVEVLRTLDLSGMTLFITLATLFVAYNVISIAPALGAQFSGGAEIKNTIGNAASGKAAQTVTIIGKKMGLNK